MCVSCPLVKTKYAIDIPQSGTKECLWVSYIGYKTVVYQCINIMCVSCPLVKTKYVLGK